MSETNAQKLKRYRAEAVKRGLCYICRCRFPRPGLRICDDCRERTRRHQKTAPKGRAMVKRTQAKSAARRSTERKSAGLCVQCGRVMAIVGYTRCSVCLDELAERIKDIARARGVMPDGRCCSVCGSPGHFAQRHGRPGVLP